MKKAQSSSSIPSVLSSEASPKTGSYSLPAGFFLAISALLYLGNAEGCYHHGHFSASVYEPYADLRSIPSADGEVDRVNVGRQLYSLRGCVACHQPNGMGNPANQCPPVAGSDWVLTEGAGRLIRIILHGAAGPMVVNGQTWNGNMTPFGPVLDDEEIANILTYIRQAPEWGNNAGEVTPEMVRAVRDATADRTAQWSAAELLRIPETE
ncbi:MAG: cytochrome c [Verrucomicrobiae bacterium]|nr:cytochrome c [Verrucomicrobiae bacterium]